MKRIAAALLCLVTALSLISCSSHLGGLHTEKGDVYPSSFLILDGKKVSFDEFRYYYLNYRDMYLAEDPAYFEKEGREEALKEEILQCLLDQYALVALAKEMDISLDRDEKSTVKTQIEEAKAPFESEEAFLESLHASYMTEKHFEDMMENAALSDKIFNALYGEGGSELLSDEEFYEYYRENYCGVQQVFIPFESGEQYRSCEKTMAKAVAVREEALAGADFWELVKTHGKDERMLSYPDGYYVTEGQCEEALWEATTALEIGEISEPVIGSTGIYVICRVELKEERMDENRAVVLYGYEDGTGVSYAGAYDDFLLEKIRERASKISVEYGEYWDQISTKTVY